MKAVNSLQAFVFDLPKKSFVFDLNLTVIVYGLKILWNQLGGKPPNLCDLIFMESRPTKKIILIQNSKIIGVCYLILICRNFIIESNIILKKKILIIVTDRLNVIRTL